MSLCEIVKGPLLGPDTKGRRGHLSISYHARVATWAHGAKTAIIDLSKVHSILQRKGEAKLLLSEAKNGPGHVLRFYSTTGEVSADERKAAVAQLLAIIKSIRSAGGSTVDSGGEAALRATAMQRSSVLRKEFSKFVESGLVSEDDFWARRQDLLKLHGLEAKVSAGSTLPSQPPDSRVDEVKGGKSTIRVDQAKAAQIFFYEPITLKAYYKFVLGKVSPPSDPSASKTTKSAKTMSPAEFWGRYMQARQDRDIGRDARTWGIVESQVSGAVASRGAPSGEYPRPAPGIALDGQDVKTSSGRSAVLAELLGNPDRFFRGIKGGAVDAWLREDARHRAEAAVREARHTGARQALSTTVTDLTASLEERLSGDYRHRSGFGTGEAARLYTPDDAAQGALDRGGGVGAGRSSTRDAVRVLARDAEAEGVFDSLNRYGAAVLEEDRSGGIRARGGGLGARGPSMESEEDLEELVPSRPGPGNGSALDGAGADFASQRGGEGDSLPRDLLPPRLPGASGRRSTIRPVGAVHTGSVVQHPKKTTMLGARVLSPDPTFTKAAASVSLHLSRAGSLAQRRPAAGGVRAGGVGEQAEAGGVDQHGIRMSIPEAYRSWCVESAAANAELMAAAWRMVASVGSSAGGGAASAPALPAPEHAQRIGHALATRLHLLEGALAGMEQGYKEYFGPLVEDLQKPLKTCIGACERIGVAVELPPAAAS